MREEAKLWFDQAKSDLQYAQRNLEQEMFYVCAFLSQQAAEKSLKALFIESRREIPIKTHNLITLGKALAVDETMLSSLRVLNADYITTRYPDAANGLPVEIYDEPMASDRFGKAAEIVKWVTRRIK